jgi:hypothetical protein
VRNGDLPSYGQDDLAGDASGGAQRVGARDLLERDRVADMDAQRAAFDERDQVLEADAIGLDRDPGEPAARGDHAPGERCVGASSSRDLITSLDRTRTSARRVGIQLLGAPWRIQSSIFCMSASDSGVPNLGILTPLHMWLPDSFWIR